MLTLPLDAPRATVDPRRLELEHLRLTLDTLTHLSRKACNEASAIDAPVNVRDCLFISVTRLETALAIVKKEAAK